MIALIIIGIALCFAVSVVLTGLVTWYLRKRAILDHPNQRSSHSAPTPRGGGWAIILTLLSGWLAFYGMMNVLANNTPLNPPDLSNDLYLLLPMLLLVGVSWLDDRRNLPAGLRLATQILVVGVGAGCLPVGQNWVLPAIIPGWLDHGLCLIGWLWFINLFNFMDGIDGLAASEAVTICLGLGLIPFWGNGPLQSFQGVSLILIGACAGFLVWNRAPAKVFMGDVGSISLGFVLGGMLLCLAASGYPVAAIILPMYFLMDASLTLLKRLIRGEKIWQAHREHAYQQAVQRGLSHRQVGWCVNGLNLALLVLALVAAGYDIASLIPTVCLLLALLLTGGLIWWFHRPFRHQQAAPPHNQ